MAGNVADIKIASNGLILLGHQPISSFDEPTAGAQVASALYKSSFESLLTTYRWRFATKKTTLARLSTTPLNTYSYIHQLPTDLLYLINTSSGTYEIYENKLYSNSQIQEIDYIYSISADRLPAYFIKAFELYLSMQFALAITGSLDKASAMRQMFELELRRAKFADATQRPAETFVDDPYNDVRY